MENNKAKELYWKVTSHKDYLPPEIRMEEDYGTYTSTVRLYTPYQCVFEAGTMIVGDIIIRRFNDGNWYDLVMETIERRIAEDLEDRFGAAIPL